MIQKIILPALFFMGLPILASAQPYYGMMGLGWGTGWGIGMMLLCLAFWILVITAVVYFIKWLVRGGEHEPRHEDRAVMILKERYAKGEIKKEEFEEKIKHLKGF